MPACLYVVSTPIGNLDDITLRALNTLKAVGLIAAEDTRRTAVLLRHFGIATPATSFHEHNEHQKLPQLLQKLLTGTDIAIVSDAGTPLVSDPGQRLVAGAIERGIPVIPIPGASAVLAAWTVSGLPASAFTFRGFAPARSNDRKQWLLALENDAHPIIFFETPHRIKRTLDDAALLLAERPIIIARELTKIYEQIFRSTTKLAPTLDIPERGEFTIIIGPPPQTGQASQPAEDKDIVEFFGQLTQSRTVPRRAALNETARKFGLSTKQIYALVERIKRPAQP
jgi:16S rRNA (cytidine1402-2'-O)-methyltransferase